MSFITAKQAADLWGVSQRRVQDMCRNGEIKGVLRHGREWLIPADAQKAKCASSAEASQQGETVKRRVYSGIIDLYKTPGSAAEIMMSLSDDEFSYDIFASQLGFYRGEFDDAIALALKHADNNETDITHRITVGNQLMLGAVYVGDIKLWRRGYDYMSKTECTNEYAKNALDFWLAVGKSVVSDFSGAPDWFKRGDFTRLPPNNFAVASYYYVKYLYTTGADLGEETASAIEIVHAMPRIIEPLISRVCIDRIILMEIYLRLLCAIAYHIAGKDEYAVPHLDRAIALALPDRLYSPLAEYRRRFGFLMDERIMLQSSTALSEIKAVSKMLIDGWTVLHNEMTGRTVSNSLSTREWQTARLATYGLSNKEIADRMGVSVNAVKQAIRMVMDKTGAESRSDIAKYI